MDVYIQDKETGWFMGPQQTWVEARAQAENFHTLLVARDYIRRRRLSHTQLLVRSRDEETFSVIPLF